MLELILGIILFMVVGIASAIDIQTREIPDGLSYGFLGAILLVRAISAVSLGWPVFWEGLLGAGVFFAIGYLLFLSGQWGGGDTKLMLGLGAVIGIAWPIELRSFLPLGLYFLLVMVGGAAYALVFLGIMAVRKWKRIIPAYRAALGEWASFHLAAAIFSAFGVALGFIVPFLWLLAVFPLLLFYLFLFISVMERTCFFRWAKPSQLVEGDWLAEPVTAHGKVFLAKKTLDADDMVLLQSQGKKVLIKDGLPFVPSFLVGYVGYILLQLPALTETFL